MTPKNNRLRITRTALITLLVVYISSYLVLSRRGFAEADAWQAEGFYFLTPRDSAAWRFGNYSLVAIYSPLILIDIAIGTGRPIASEPMWSISMK
jgi:hypothetical protein